MELFCANGLCKQEIIGRGVLMWDPSRAIDWSENGVENVLHTTNADGQENQALVLHMNCFQQVFDAIARREDAAVITVVVGGVGDFKMVLEGVEEDD